MLTATEAAYEKLDQAVYNLATGAGEIRDRLLFAGWEVVLIQREGLPEWARSEVDSIALALTGGATGTAVNGAMETTLRGMKRTVGVRIAKQICQLRSKVLRSLDPEPHL
jgi:hypothetical protein